MIKKEHGGTKVSRGNDQRGARNNVKGEYTFRYTS